MKVAGIIAEYNPFHNGHLYQINKTKEDLGNDYTIAVMSGNFVMRGEPALFNKFIRAKCAVMGGVDLVLELSTPYALSSSEYFAKAGVSLLDSLNIVDYLSFGSEAGDLSSLSEIADILIKEETTERIKENQKKGIPVFAAISEEFNEEDKEILKSPNNILGINYLKALKNLNSKIEPYTVPRIKTDYNSKDVKDNFASATGIRELLKEKNDISSYVPREVFELLKNEDVVFEEEFDRILTYILRIKKTGDLEKYADVTEGINNLIIKAGKSGYGVENIASLIKSKRYAFTRIKRILYNILLDIDKSQREIKPEFARVLAFNEKGRELIAKINKKSDIPVFTNITKDMFEKYEILNTDLRATEIYRLGLKNKDKNIDRILL